MWKSVFLLRDAIFFYPQTNVKKEILFNRLCGEKTAAAFFHRLSFHNSQVLLINFGKIKGRN